ncbi:hypothetical protein B9Z19DRAFT_1175138 [Tuber borchii]|uniref:Alcohol dehydrogenase-like C-terminal domain-containing protein n=1 Tax=Tuber borchii TaxID=42251 RepID=A0A2T6ZW53_TUBBO|nr:hypothetical protein B9Z19DRAFT_1175138 [Tuber borchii]
MGFRVMAINTGSETQEIFLNAFGAEEFVDFAKGDVMANVKSVARGLGPHVATLLAVSENPSQQAAEGSYVGNRLDTQEAIDFFARGLIKVPFKVGKLSELTQAFQLLEEGKIAGRYVLDTSK